MKTAAERQALKRQREALGLVEAKAWVPCELVDWLIRLGAISEADDPEEIGLAIVIFAIAQAEDVRGFAFPSQRDGLARIIGV